MDFGFIAVLFCWRQHTPHGLVSPAGKFGWLDGSCQLVFQAEKCWWLAGSLAWSERLSAFPLTVSSALKSEKIPGEAIFIPPAGLCVPHWWRTQSVFWCGRIAGVR